MRVFDFRNLAHGVRVAATGACLPERRVTNAELVALGIPLSESEIETGLGILERRWCSVGQATSDLATVACNEALRHFGLSPQEVGRLIVATVTSDHPSPSTACFVHYALGLGSSPAYDITATCSGFLFALDQGVRAVLTGESNALICAADSRSKFLNIRDRASAAVFGDGAGSALLVPCESGRGVLGIGLMSDGRGRHTVYVPAGGSRSPTTVASAAAGEQNVRMSSGPEAYLAMLEGMVGTTEQLLAGLHLSLEDLAMIVPHQGNGRVIARLPRLLRVPDEKIFQNVKYYGNMSGASTAVAFHEALGSGRLNAGDKVLLVAGGAGYTAGAAVVEVDEALLLQTNS